MTNICELIKKEFEGINIVKISEQNDQVVLSSEMKNLDFILSRLVKSKNMKYEQLLDITAVDYPDRLKRFDLIYVLLSHNLNSRIIVKVPLREEDSALSITNIFTNADWYEREIFDMFGIDFSGHSNLKRILTEDNFVGHPLRKDFDLAGPVNLIFDEANQEFKYQKIGSENVNEFSMENFESRDEYNG